MPRGYNRINLLGQKFGMLTVIEYAGCGRDSATWLCRCDCGGEKIAYSALLRKGQTSHCGCLIPSIKSRVAQTHGQSGTPLYKKWRDMISRCEFPSNFGYPWYGGRGITVCERWRRSFVSFADDVGQPPSPKHSLDRIDVNGNYEPGNCRWATWAEQCRNKRSNRLLTLGDRTMCLEDWANALNIRSACLSQRLMAGWTVERTLTTPSRGRRGRKAGS
jgi:hypothetical protein